MSEHIISQNSNDVFYAYSRGRFWRWDESARVWKESHLLAQKFGKAKTVEKRLTPEVFLTSDEFIPMDDYELPGRMIAALRDAKPCKAAPVDPVEEESSSDVPTPCICSTCTCGGCKEECFGNCRSCGHPVQECNSYQTEGEKHLTPAHSEDVAEPFGNIPADSSFDFSALGDLSEQAVAADRQFDLHYGAAQDEYLISCIYLARIHALTAKAGRYGGGTWTKWYESKGLSEGSARTMVKNGDAFNSATVAELKQLPELTRKDLNLIARSGCARQFVDAAGDGQRVQELLEQIKAEKERATAAEAREEEAWKMQSKAETRAQDAEKQLEGSRQVAEAAKRRADKWQAEAESLKKQPITAVVDKEEVDKRAGEKAYKMASDMTAELKAQLEQATADNEQDARNAYDGLLLAGRTITNAWQMAKPLFAKLPEDQRDTAANQLVRTLSNIQGEVSRCL